MNDLFEFKMKSFATNLSIKGLFFLLIVSQYFIMGRKTKKCSKKCPNHLFLLKPVHYSAAFSRELQTSFCPSSLAAPSITPKFNRDKRHYTISFMLPVDYKKLEKNQEYNKIEHENYKMKIDEQKSKILIAKPKFKSQYCNVCQIEYEDYLDHIRSEDHKNRINNNKFNDFINDMCDQMQIKVKEEEFRQQDSKYVHSSQTNMYFSSQDHSQFDDKMPQKNCNSFFSGLEYKQIYDLFNSNNQNISLLPQFLQHNHNFQLNHQDNDVEFAVPQFSPAKKYSQVTQCLKIVPQVKINRPIILCGGNCLKLE